MSSQMMNTSPIVENGQMSDPLSDVDVFSCSNCELKFNKQTDLELHCKLHNKNNDYKCSLCDDVFSDLEQLKLHDLRHSLEEAEEDVTDIEQMILPFGLKSCDICGEKFSSDEELINHSVQHPEVVKADNLEENLSSDEEPMNQPESNDSEINYQILRQEIVKDKNGRTDIRFILIDHQNEQVEEFTHTIHEPVASVKKTLSRNNVKRNGTIEKSKSIKKPKVVKKRIKSEVDLVSSDDDVTYVKSKNVNKPKTVKKRIKSENDEVSSDDSVTYVKSKTKNVNKRTKSKNMITKDIKSEDDASVKDIKSEDDDIICEGSNSKLRRSKQIALKRKIWNEKIHLPPPQKLRDCPTCNKSFGDMDDYKKHILTHKPKSESLEEQSGPDSFKNKTTSKDTQIKVEKNSDSENDHADWVDISCEICYNTFSRKKGLRKHLINVHKLDSKKASHYLQKIQHNTASFHTCKQCKKQFYRESKLHSHDCVPAISVICELCKQKFASKSGLKRHLLNIHKLSESKTNQIMNELSSYNARFYRKLEAAGEIVVSSSDGRIVVKKKGSKFNILEGDRCETCNKAFADEYESDVHKCIPKIEIKCEICKYNSPSKYNLKRHLIRIHKLPLSDADKAMSEFKCYNERLILRYPEVKKKKSFSKSPSPKKAALSKGIMSSKSNSAVLSKKLDLKKQQDLKKRAKEILLKKGKKLLLNKNNKPIKAPLLHRMNSGSSSSKKSNVSILSSSKKTNSSLSSSSKKPKSSISTSSKKPKSPGPSSSKKPKSSVSSSSKKPKSSGSSASKKPKLSDIAKKKEKMKHTSADSVKKVAAKKLVSKSKKYFGKNASPRLLRSNKK